MKDPSLKGSSFSFDQKPVSPGMIVTVDGSKFTGKTRWASTGPDPVALQAIDAGDDGVVQPLQAEGRRIAWSNYPYVWDPKAKDSAKQGEHLRNTVWKTFHKDFYIALERGFRTVVWDTGTEVWALKRLSEFGKLAGVPELQYPKVNAEFLQMLKDARKAGVVMILLHHLKEERERYTEMTPNGPKEKSKTTGRWIRDGMSRIEGQVDVILKSRYYAPRKDKKGKLIVPAEGETNEGYFEFEVGEKSRFNKDAVGMTFVNPDFAEIASIVHPKVDPELWLPGAQAVERKVANTPTEEEDDGEELDLSGLVVEVE